jgi:hypothetical protein
MEIYTKEIGESSKMKKLSMAMANSFYQILYNKIKYNNFMKEIGSMIPCKVLAFIIMSMVIFIRENGNKTSMREGVECNSLMEHFMMVNGKIIIFMGMVFLKII